jgi:hypothetical protein
MHGGKGKDAAERRLAKMEAGYIFPGNSSDTKRCAGCSMFIAGPSDINACTLVEGAIETNAVCKHFAERKADADMIAAARDDGITVSTRDGIGHIIGTDGESEAVFVIDMYGPKGTFERHQVMLGFPDQTAAIEAYNAMWPSTAKAGFAKLTPTRPGVLQRWLKHGDKGQPFSAGQSMRLVT